MNHHATNEQKGSQCPCRHSRCFEVFPALLILEAEPETKKFREIIIMNRGGTLSLMREAFFIPTGETEPIRIQEIDEEKHKCVMDLCDAYYIDHTTLVSLN